VEPRPGAGRRYYPSTRRRHHLEPWRQKLEASESPYLVNGYGELCQFISACEEAFRVAINPQRGDGPADSMRGVPFFRLNAFSDNDL
jgi:hypothetical protein